MENKRVIDMTSKDLEDFFEYVSEKAINKAVDKLKMESVINDDEWNTTQIAEYMGRGPSHINKYFEDGRLTNVAPPHRNPRAKATQVIRLFEIVGPVRTKEKLDAKRDKRKAA